MVDTVINSDIKASQIVLLGANYDKTSSFGKGADKATKIIKDILDHQIELYERYTKSSPSGRCRISYKDLGNLNKLSPEKMVSTIKDSYRQLFDDDKFIITIGGEHSITNGPLQAIAASRRFRPEDVTVVQLDAHFDLREDDSDYNDKPYGKYAHSAVMRRISESGFRTVHIGIRAYSKDEYDYAMKNNSRITYFEWGAGKGNALFTEPSLNDILTSIKTKYVYLTIDVDGFDPSVMPETGTPVPGGFSWDYGVKLIGKIFSERNVIGADIVEVAPRDKDSYTAYNAAQIVHNMIAQHAKKNIQ